VTVKAFIEEYLYPSTEKKELEMILKAITETAPKTIVRDRYDGVADALPVARKILLLGRKTEKRDYDYEKIVKTFNDCNTNALERFGNFETFASVCDAAFKIGDVASMITAYNAMEKIDSESTKDYWGDYAPDNFYYIRYKTELSGADRLEYVANHTYKEKAIVDFTNKDLKKHPDSTGYLPFGEYCLYKRRVFIGTLRVDKDEAVFKAFEDKTSAPINVPPELEGDSDYELPNDDEINDNVNANPYAELINLPEGVMSPDAGSGYLKPAGNVVAPIVVIGPQGAEEKSHNYALLRPGGEFTYTRDSGGVEVEIRRVFIDNNEDFVTVQLSSSGRVENVSTLTSTLDAVARLKDHDTYKLGMPITLDPSNHKVLGNESFTIEGLEDAFFLVSVKKIEETAQADPEIIKKLKTATITQKGFNTDFATMFSDGKYGHDLGKEFAIKLEGYDSTARLQYSEGKCIGYVHSGIVDPMKIAEVGLLLGQNFPKELPQDTTKVAAYRNLRDAVFNYYVVTKIIEKVEYAKRVASGSVGNKAYEYGTELSFLNLAKGSKIREMTEARAAWDALNPADTEDR